MVNTKTRKAVYIPGEIWDQLRDIGKQKYDSVTTVLKNILIDYLEKGNKNTYTFKKILQEKDDDEKEIVYETADLVYHCMVALALKNISPDRVKQALARRFDMSGIAEKNYRKE